MIRHLINDDYSTVALTCISNLHHVIYALTCRSVMTYVAEFRKYYYDHEKEIDARLNTMSPTKKLTAEVGRILIYSTTPYLILHSGKTSA